MSEQYRALTRKYRPQNFDEIVSQQHVSSTLKNAIEQDRLSHAYMFSGPRGVGKTTMARVLAREVNDIGEDVDGEALNQTLNVIEIDAASNNKVEDIRELRERVRVPPQSGRYKIYIIDEVHMLSKSAFNAFLKTLEEPPPHVIFIFATTEPNKVLPTILSRVQRFDFRRLKVSEIVSHLRTISDKEDINVDDESLHVIAKKADGALRDALGLMDQAISFCGTDIQHDKLLHALNVVSTDRLFELTGAIEQHNADKGLTIIHDVLREGYDIQEFLTELLEHFRNLYVAKNSEQMYLVEASGNTKKRYREKSDAFSRDDLMRMLHITGEAQYKVKEAQQPRIQFEIAILKLIHMQRSQTLSNLIDGLEELKKNYNFESDESQNVNGHLASDQAKPPHPAETGPDAGEAQRQANGNQEDKPAEEIQNKKDSPTETSDGIDAENENVPARSSQTTPDELSEDQNGSISTEHPPTQDAEPAARSDSAKQSPAGKSSKQQQTNNPTSNRYDFFGGSSLNKYKSKISEQIDAEDKAEQTDSAQVRQVDPASLTLPDLKESWIKFVNQLQDDIQQMLHIQLERMEPVDLKNRKVILRCDNDFAQKLIREHRQELTKRFSKFIGTGVKIDARVVNKQENNKKSKSPYERFKELQNKDPKIRTIVEMFGAELEY